MPPVKRIYMIVVGFSILVVSLILAIVPRYLEISRLALDFESELSKLEEAYHRYVNQKNALDELKLIMKEPPEMSSLKIDGLRVERSKDGYMIIGKIDGISFMKIVDEVVRNPSAYFEEIDLSNFLENPITISGSTRSDANVAMKIRILELRE